MKEVRPGQTCQQRIGRGVKKKHWKSKKTGGQRIKEEWEGKDGKGREKDVKRKDKKVKKGRQRKHSIRTFEDLIKGRENVAEEVRVMFELLW